MTGTIVWFTGLPASGKTTLATTVRSALDASGTPSILLDSDELRRVLGADRYDEVGRDAFYRILGQLALVLARQGHIVLVAATAPKRAHRDRIRADAPGFVEVWVSTPRAECEARDPKRLYARARSGDASGLPGLGVPYEPPLAPEVIAKHDIAPAVDAIVRRVRGRPRGEASARSSC